MSLNATLDSFNNGLLHGASGAGMFVQAMQDLPEQLSIGGTSISTALSTVAGVFSDFANAIGLGRFTRTANENQLLLENANESSNLEKFLGQVKDSRKLVGYGSGSSFDRARQMVGMGGSSAQYDYSNDQQRIANVYYKYHGKDSGALKGMGSFTQDPSKKGYIKWSDAGMSREQKAQALSKMFTQLQQDLVTKQQEAKDREDKLLQTFDDALGENTKATILNTGALDRNTKPDVGPITLEDRMEQGRKKYTGVADAKQSQHAKSAK